MATTAYADPSGNGTNTFGYGSYTNVNGGVRQPSTPTSSPVTSERIYANAGGSLVCELTFSIPAVANARVTSITCWRHKVVSGNLTTSLAYEFGGALGNGSSSSGSGTGWHSMTWDNLGIDLSSGLSAKATLTGPATIGKADQEDEHSEFYWEYTYEDVSAEDECYNAAQVAHESSGGAVTVDPGDTRNVDDVDEWVGFAFSDVALQQAESITSAILLFKTGAVDADAEVILAADDSDDAAAFAATANNISSRTLTTAQLTLSDELPSGSPVAVDVTSLVQEIVNRAGWTSGSRLVFPMEGQEHHTDDFNIDLSVTPQLCIDHPLPAGGGGGGGGGGVPGPSPTSTGNAGPYPTVLVPRGPSVPHLHAYDFNRLEDIPANTVLGRNTATHNVSALDDDAVFDMTRISRDSLKAPSYVRLFEANIVPAAASEVDLIKTGDATQIGSPAFPSIATGDAVRFALDYQFESVGGADRAVIDVKIKDLNNTVRPLLTLTPDLTNDGTFDASITGYIMFRSQTDSSEIGGSAKLVWSRSDASGDATGVLVASNRNGANNLTGQVTIVITATIPIGYGDIHFRQGFVTKAGLRS